MANVAKHTKAACGHMFKHYERAKDEQGEYVKFGNTSIDPERTHQNYNLAPDRGMSQGDFVRQRCGEVYCFNRKDVNVMCSWIVTAPAAIAGTKHEKEFFEETYSFLAGRYGEENIVSAYVHMDEVTPHMHFAFVPVVEDKKRGLKVSAKEKVNRADLKAFHSDLDRHLQQRMGERYPGGILNQATQEGNRSIEELKRKSAEERLAEAEKKASKMLDKAQVEVNGLRLERNALEDAIEGNTVTIGTFSEIDKIGKPTLLGKNVTMSREEASKLKEQAKAYWAAKNDKEKAQTQAKVLLERYGHYAKITPKLQKEKVELTRDNQATRQRLSEIVRVLESSPELLQAYRKQADLLQKQEREAKQKRGLELER